MCNEKGSKLIQERKTVVSSVDTNIGGKVTNSPFHFERQQKQPILVLTPFFSCVERPVKYSNVKLKVGSYSKAIETGTTCEKTKVLNKNVAPKNGNISMVMRGHGILDYMNNDIYQNYHNMKKRASLIINRCRHGIKVAPYCAIKFE